MKLWLFLALLPAVWAQNPNPCSQIRNTAVAGQVLSAINSGPTPPCQWITGGGGGGGGTVTQVSGTQPIQVASGTTTPVVSCRTATGSVSGCLSAADWTTFNGKGDGSVTSVGLAGTANQIVVTGATPITGSGSWTLSLSPTLVLPNGTTGTTQSGGDNSTKIATTAYVDTAGGSFVPTSRTISTTSPLGGGGALSSNLTLTCSTCVTGGSLTSGQLLKGNTGQAITVGDLNGDATTSGSMATTVVKVNGIAYSATAAAHTVQVTTTANTTVTAKVLPDCTDTGGNHLNFTQSTDAFSCGNSGGGGTVTCASGVTNNYGCLLETCTPSAVAQCDFTAITSTYDEYVLEAVSVVCANNAVQAELQVSTDGGANFITSGYTWMANELAADSASGSIAESSSDSKIVWGGSRGSPGIGNGTGKSFSGFLFIYNPLSASLYKTFMGKESHIYQSNTTLIGGDIWGQYQSATAVNALRFRFNDGTVRNISSGIMRLYGRSKT